MEIKYHQINPSDKNNELKYLKYFYDNDYAIISIETIDNEFDKFSCFSIDPQHGFGDSKKNSRITSIEYIFNYKDEILKKIDKRNKILMITVKPDLDSLGSMALLTLIINNEFKIDGDLILRLKAIAKSDRHGRSNWKNKQEDFFFIREYTTYGIPCGLFFITSSRNLTCDEKIKIITQYLLTGTFDDVEKYNKKAIKKIKKAKKKLKINIIIPKKLCLIESRYRGALSYGYRYTPCVIAINELFSFNIENEQVYGKKITIAQYEDKYMDMEKILNDINEIESGWGGSSVIIGSPIDRPSTIDEKQLIDICKKHIY